MQRSWNVDFYVQLDAWLYALNLNTSFIACNDTHFWSWVSFLRIWKQYRSKSIYSCFLHILHEVLDIMIFFYFDLNAALSSHILTNEAKIFSLEWFVIMFCMQEFVASSSNSKFHKKVACNNNFFILLI